MHDKLEIRAFLLFLVIVTIGFFWVLKPFFGAVFWACAITVIFYPLNQRLLKKLKGRRNLTALTTLLLCILVVILPVIFIVSSVVAEGLALYEKLQSGEIKPAVYIEQVRSAFPLLEQTLERFNIELDNLTNQAGDAAIASGKFLAQHTFSIGQNAFSFLINIALMLYMTFFFLRDGDKLVNLLIRALPLGDARERQLFAKFAEVTRATIKGNLVVAMVQGSLGGLIFWLLGIQAAILWGVLMAFLSLLPAVGASLVWIPFAIYLLATDQVTNGLILIAFGAIVIGLVDNILRPILVGRDTRMPDYLILLTTLGGIALFGISGFVIGPVIAALFIAFWGIFMHEFQRKEPEPVTATADENSPPLPPPGAI
jgi:predicted PurR-regulated permease PerM